MVIEDSCSHNYWRLHEPSHYLRQEEKCHCILLWPSSPSAVHTTKEVEDEGGRSAVFLIQESHAFFFISPQPCCFKDDNVNNT